MVAHETFDLGEWWDKRVMLLLSCGWSGGSIGRPWTGTGVGTSAQPGLLVEMHIPDHKPFKQTHL